MHRFLPLTALALVSAAARAQPDAAAYRVYPLPVESPIHTTPPPPADARVLVVGPARAPASPFGWHDTDGTPGPEFTTTQGNNALAYLDRTADNTPHPGDFPDGGPSLLFDFPLDLTQPPTAYGNAVVADLFFWTNVVHDVLYGYGFDEAAGNFQENTYGRGGLGGDPVRAEAQDGSGTNGGNFFTPPDGARPRMQMFVWTLASPPRDGALDHGIVVHELTHGLTQRLTGGPGTTSCLNNAEQPGEGWSDWYALMLTMEPGDIGPDPRGIATYVLGQPPDGPGLRPVPYTTDFLVNDYTYGDTRTLPVPHGTGFVWGTILWEVAWDLIATHGFDPDLYDADGGAGNQLILNLVTEGMKLQPCSPGFVDARDAILAADQALYGGAHTTLLWTAFARRGLGFSASQGSPNTNADNQEAFDVPTTTAAEPAVPDAPLVLDPVAPNPVRGTARLTFVLSAPGPVRLALYDVRGREVAVLMEPPRPAGRHTARLDVRGLAAGVYVLRLEANGAVRTQRLVVAR